MKIQFKILGLQDFITTDISKENYEKLLEEVFYRKQHTMLESEGKLFIIPIDRLFIIIDGE